MLVKKNKDFYIFIWLVNIKMLIFVSTNKQIEIMENYNFITGFRLGVTVEVENIAAVTNNKSKTTALTGEFIVVGKTVLNDGTSVTILMHMDTERLYKVNTVELFKTTAGI